MKNSPLAVLASVLVLSCSPSATPERALATAERYALFEWTPAAVNIRHGVDRDGIMVHTPDSSLLHYGDHRGYWKPGVPSTAMPYKWGGFDTPESFLRGLEQGRYAGDIATKTKVRGGRALVSRETIGVDCSGLVSRCWGLPRQYSTAELPGICERLGGWKDLRAGDILLKTGHVILFAEWQGDWAFGYEAGPEPVWRVRKCRIHRSALEREGFAPWRFKDMKAPRPHDPAVPKKTAVPTGDSGSAWTFGPY